MRPTPVPVAEFLEGKRLGVAGVSRKAGQTANLIYDKLRGAGYEVLALNPATSEARGIPCYPDIRTVPGAVDGVVFAAPPAAAVDVVKQCAERGVPRIWFHRSFGQGSVSAEAVAECGRRGVTCIVGGCPLMYVAPVDVAHRCLRWILRLGGRVPG